MRRSALLCLLATPLSLFAQTNPPAPTGSVSGHITLGDTQRPARFATVVLYAVPTSAGPTKKDLEKADDLGSMMSAMMGGVTLSQGSTGLDGEFSISGLPAGDYYVFATASGYEGPVDRIQAAVDSGADPAKPIPGLPVVHVSANSEARLDTTIQRGASVSGTVTWDDGSPVSGAHMKVEPAKGKGKDIPPAYAMLVGAAAGANALGSLLAITDDHGHYRVTGLAPGEYVVTASLNGVATSVMVNGKIDMGAARAATPIVIYAPHGYHRADAHTVTLQAGQEQADVDLSVDLTGTHSVSGHVSAMDTHQALNAGNVTLTDQSDKAVKRTAAVDANGNYTVRFVPSGSYDLTLDGGAIKEATAKPAKGMFQSQHTVRSFDEEKTTVVVAASDVTGQNLELKPAKKTEQDMDPNELFKALGGSSK